jgi:acetolactate synthase-1/2/3 large subunit
VVEARRLFADFKHVILVGAQRPVFAFAGPDEISGPESAGTTFVALGTRGDDLTHALQSLCFSLGCKEASPSASQISRPREAIGAISSEAFGQSLSALLPQDAIVVDEGVSFGRSVYGATHHARSHDWLQLTGGAIGSGLPLATGAALAAPQRRVITLQADGSGLYNVQALWTQAREQLDVTTVIFANRRYEILYAEMRRMGVTPGPNADQLFKLGNPEIDWVSIARGFGVEAASATTMNRFNDLFAHSLTRKGPFLIELQTE